MKRFIALILVVFMIFTFVGCSSSSGNQGTSSGQAAKPGAPSEMTIVSGGSGGTFYYMATGQAKILSESIPGLSVTNESTGGSPVENGTFVSKRVDTLGLTNLDGIVAAAKGDKSRGFDKPMDNLRLIQMGHIQIVYMIVLESSGVKSVADLKGKKIALPTAGQTTYFQALEILRAYGLTEKDYSGTPMTYQEAADALKDGTVACAMMSGSIPQASVTDLNTTKNIRLLSIEKEIIDKILKDYPGWGSLVIPGNTYSDQKEDVNALTVKTLMFCNADLDEELVYKITKTLNEKADKMKEIHANGAEWGLESTKPIYENPPVPFHPGAVRYYKEVFGK